jgi:hypothetical protein
MAKVIAACLVIGALSLALPSEPSYDPWAWLVWGREIAHLELNTAGGPSWKPLPVAVTAALSPLGALDSSLPVSLWIVFTRAASLATLVLAFRLASRLARGGPAGLAAGAVATTGLVLLPDWFQFAAQGSDAPVAVGLMLWAIERHLDGSPRAALILGALASLLRPELFVFLLAYLGFTWLTERELRALAGATGILVPVLWLVPEWIGAGNPLDGGRQAASEPYWSLSHAEIPWLRALERVHNHAGVTVEVMALVGLAAALALRRRDAIAIALCTLIQIAAFAAMTQAGFSGNARYVLPALALMCVLAGVGLAALMSTPRLATVAAVGLVALAVPSTLGRVERLRTEAREVGARMELHRQLVGALRMVGGAGVVNRCGAPAVNRALQTRMAWELHIRIDDLERAHNGCFAFESSRSSLAGKPAPRGRAAAIPVIRFGNWRVYRVYRRFAGLSHPCERLEELGDRVRRGTDPSGSQGRNGSASLPYLPNPDARSFHDHDHRSRIPGSRQREHDPADHRRWARCRGRYRQALLEPPAQVLPDQEGRAGDRQDGHRARHRRRLATFPAGWVREPCPGSCDVDA